MEPTLTIFEGDPQNLNGWYTDLKKGSRKVYRTGKRWGKKTVSAATYPNRVLYRNVKKGVEKVADAILDTMPTWMKKKVRSTTKKIAGDKVTAATKAAFLSPIMSAALSIPGAQPYAAAIGVLVNETLDELIKKARSKSSSAKKKANSVSTKKTGANMPKRYVSKISRLRDEYKAAAIRMQAKKAALKPSYNFQEIKRSNTLTQLREKMKEAAAKKAEQKRQLRLNPQATSSSSGTAIQLPAVNVQVDHSWKKWLLGVGGIVTAGLVVKKIAS